MPRHLISDAHEWINEIPTVPIYYLAIFAASNGLTKVVVELMKAKTNLDLQNMVCSKLLTVSIHCTCTHVHIHTCGSLEQ